jgi:hypothetical protein
VVLTGRSVRDEIKSTCASHGLDEKYFSAHSLRKGAITHMRSQGTSVDDRLDRGNYAPNSRVMSLTYDQSVGLGPCDRPRTVTVEQGPKREKWWDGCGALVSLDSKL